VRFAVPAGGGGVVGFWSFERGGGGFVGVVGGVGGRTSAGGCEEGDDEEEVEPGAEGEEDGVEEAGCEGLGVEVGEGALLRVEVSFASWGAPAFGEEGGRTKASGRFLQSATMAIVCYAFPCDNAISLFSLALKWELRRKCGIEWIFWPVLTSGARCQMTMRAGGGECGFG